MNKDTRCGICGSSVDNLAALQEHECPKSPQVDKSPSANQLFLAHLQVIEHNLIAVLNLLDDRHASHAEKLDFLRAFAQVRVRIAKLQYELIEKQAA